MLPIQLSNYDTSILPPLSYNTLSINPLYAGKPHTEKKPLQYHSPVESSDESREIDLRSGEQGNLFLGLEDPRVWDSCTLGSGLVAAAWWAESAWLRASRCALNRVHLMSRDDSCCDSCSTCSSRWVRRA